MRKLCVMGFLLACVMAVPELFAFPTVFPHGTTIYQPDKCWNGYTVFGTEVDTMHGMAVPDQGTVLIDMNGNVVHQWKQMSIKEHPVKLLPGGYIMGATREKTQDIGRIWKDPASTDLAIMDWSGKIVWTCAKAGMHHDFQIAGNPVGYYVPGMEMSPETGNVLILSHKVDRNKKMTHKKLYDDYIVEIDREGNVLWDWLANEHFEEMGFSEEAKNTMYKYPTYSATRTRGVQGGDWIHVNSASYVGPNKWYDEDPVTYAAFHPDNLIIDGRQTNTISIIDRKTKKRVWQLGPDYSGHIPWTFNGKVYAKAYEKLGQMIGIHHAHMIPKGLPGEGNILVFDNGGAAGYGAPNPGAPMGWNNAVRDSSRVVEFNPITLEIVWEYSAKKAGYREHYKFYSDYVSSAQRLPNGNTFITVGAVGQLMEVTPKHEIVWEYISPYYSKRGKYNLVYRAYRVPYDWVPQLEKPDEEPVDPGDVSKLRMKDLTSDGDK